MNLRIKEEDLELIGIDSGGNEILHYQGGPFTGIMYKNADNESLAYEVEFQNGYREGRVKYYHSNGQLQEEYQLHDNIVVDGTFKSYDEEGNLIESF
ncbi:hypothetical protein [uncultured Psychroserpens sp.]|uniref:toxin-antitoxin system YwqK family antitoxin n=1 Tax=uncultured Psychroserpens sp. TaxID=255436 RepID=UPI0026123513|nr:hypothetical protein [uncultured Psychroserpens sp.]